MSDSPPLTIGLEAWQDCRPRWRALLAVGCVCRAVGVLVIAPVSASVLRLAIAGTGDAVLTDQDLLYFVTSLWGGAGLLVAAVLSAAATAIEYAVLLAVLDRPPRSIGVTDAVRVALANAWRVLRLATRFVLQTLAWIAPAGVVAAGVYAWLLSRFDINYYLAERPPAFWAAAAAALLIAGYALVVVTRLIAVWFVALPAVVLEQVPTESAYTISQQRTEPCRWVIRGWVIGWLVASAVLSSLGATLVVAAARTLAPWWPSSLAAIATGVGLTLAALVLVGLTINLLSTAGLAALMRRLYLHTGGREDAAPDGAPEEEGGWRLTRGRLAAVALLTLLAALTAGFLAVNSVPMDNDVLVIGHRGAPRSAPENTLSAVRAAIEQGADWVEIDVQESADGEVVVVHDSDFMRLAGVDLKVWDTTADAMAEIDLGSNFGPEFAGEGVPTLADVLEACRGKAGLLVELKYYGHDVDLERRVTQVVEHTGMAEQTTFMSLQRRCVTRLKELRPDWRVGQLLSVSVGDARAIEADFLAVNASFVSRDRVRRAHRDGFDLYAWTADQPSQIAALASRGVDGVITNTPAVARAVIAEREAMSPAARLLLALADRFGVLENAEWPEEPPTQGAATTSDPDAS